jgi:tRNA G18 (ribose-2'-O)-methylase SpoU
MKRKGQEIYLILHNIRSTFNVGSIFRTADAAGIKKICLCGYTPTPDNQKVAKTSLGAERYVPWEYHKQTWRLLRKLSADGIQIVALEQTKKSVDYRQFKPKFPIALMVGNEVKGLSKKILARADKIIAIPMYGNKESLNVAVATGIAVYKIIESTYSR